MIFQNLVCDHLRLFFLKDFYSSNVETVFYKEIDDNLNCNKYYIYNFLYHIPSS